MATGEKGSSGKDVLDESYDHGGWIMQRQHSETGRFDGGIVIDSSSVEQGGQFRIRRGELCDLAQIVDLWLEGQSNGLRLDRASIEGFFQPYLQSQNERFGFWVADSDDCTGGSLGRSIIGWQSLLPCRVNPAVHGDWAESSTYIRRNIRARGVGRALLTHVTNEASVSGLRKIVGYVRSDNAAMQRICDGLNWTKIGSVPGDHDGDPSRFYYVYSVPARRQGEFSDQSARR